MKFVRGDDWGYQIFVRLPRLTQVFIFFPWDDWVWTPRQTLWTICFNYFCLMIYYNYYLACSTDPGSPPSNWIDSYEYPESEYIEPAQINRRLVTMLAGRRTLSQEEEENQPLAELAKNKPEFRWCNRCDNYKPPRGHHCSVCKKCILKMDHHCCWINNCVGYYNQGHFYRFLVYVCLACGLLFGTFIYFLSCKYEEYVYNFHRPVEDRRWSLSMGKVVLVVFDMIMVGFVLLSVGILCLYHTYYVATNTTTIESWERDKVLSLARRKRIKLGIFNNIRTVLGDSILFWLWPQELKGDGIRYKVRKGLKEEDMVWPPAWYVKEHQDREFTSDEEFEEEEQAKYNTRVRRGSEGYVVRPITNEDREKMVQELLSSEDE